MPNKLPITPGQRSGRWTVLESERYYVTYRGKRRSAAKCRCDCGTIRIVPLDRIRGRKSLSCGCLTSELRADWVKVKLTIHGLSRHPLYRTWQTMRHRCENPRSKDYPAYGARGISVCAEWRDVTAFIAWIEANIGPRPAGRTLDRIDNDRNYEPGNVRWATAKEQSANRRRRAA